MLQLNQLLPPSESEPYWILNSQYNPELPEEMSYIIVEYYCDNTACACQSLIADVMALDNNKQVIMNSLALIRYDWSSRETRCAPKLTEEAEQTHLAFSLLAAYKNLVHSEIYQTRIKEQHARVKKLAFERDLKHNQLKKSRFIQRVGRNHPCPCGSNKKYKKCCLNN